MVLPVFHLKVVVDKLARHQTAARTFELNVEIFFCLFVAIFLAGHANSSRRVSDHEKFDAAASFEQKIREAFELAVHLRVDFEELQNFLALQKTISTKKSKFYNKFEFLRGAGNFTQRHLAQFLKTQLFTAKIHDGLVNAMNLWLDPYLDASVGNNRNFNGIRTRQLKRIM